jgi:DNA-binding response OmpR family regulator
MVQSAKYLPLAEKSILLVEDDAVVAQSILHCLQDAGAEVLIARKAADALPIVERSNFAAAVLDVELGDGDSTVVCQRLSERAIPFLFYSGYDDTYVSTKWPGALVVSKPASRSLSRPFWL